MLAVKPKGHIAIFLNTLNKIYTNEARNIAYLFNVYMEEKDHFDIIFMYVIKIYVYILHVTLKL